MRFTLIALLTAAALWRAWLDWRETIGEGYAYRLTSFGAALEDAAPDRAQALEAGLRGTGASWLWDPVATTVLALPFSVTLLAVAGLLWITRRRGR